MLLLGLDLETTGLDIERCGVIEVGLVLWDWELGVPVKIFSELINEPNRPEINKSFIGDEITEEMIEKYGQIPYNTRGGTGSVMEPILELFEEADAIVTCNGNKFDKLVLERFLLRYEYAMSEKIWIDIVTDIKYPPLCAYRSLIYLAGYHGFVNPLPHRALFDTVSTLKILGEYDIEEVLERAKSPLVALQALVSYDNRKLAKDAGFWWIPDEKIWCKDVKEIDITPELMSELGFEVKVLG